MEHLDEKPGAATSGAEQSPTKIHIFDNPRNVRRAIHALYAICAVSLLLDFAIHRHVDHPWEGVWGFYALYGFVACVILVLVAKELRKLVMRGEDYYDDR